MSAILKNIITWVCRLTVGSVFIFSGVAKGIDPWGTFYMISDYFAIWNLNIADNLILVADFLLFIIEFIVGICIVFGCFRRSAPILLAAIMAFMLPLTLWIAIKNPVADCGCFGQALIISNWATFWKNVVLSAMAIWLIKFNSKSLSLIKPYCQWMEMIVAGSFILIIGLIGYNYQPLLDFRPYKVGTPLFSENNDADTSDVEYKFIYEKNGVEKEFNIDDKLPDEEDGWTFKKRVESNSSNKKSSHSNHNNDENKNITLWDESGSEDLTDEIASDKDIQLILMMPELSKVSIATTYKINFLNSWAEKENIDFFAVVSGDPTEIENWKDLSLADYPIYTADDTSIKEVVRGNPAIVYLENGIIVWKGNLKTLDIDYTDQEEPNISKELLSFNNSRLLLNISLIFVALTAALIMVSYSPALAKFFFIKTPNKPAMRSKKP